MTRAMCLGSAVAVLCLAIAGGAHATNVGMTAGFDPTGILLVNALTELPVSPDFDLRAEVGIATGDMAGLMLITGLVLGHRTFGPADPFLGLGAGVALTPPPFTTGLVVEGAAGVRVALFDGLALLAEVRYLVRWLEDGFTSGPVYEAGLEVQF